MRALIHNTHRAAAFGVLSLMLAAVCWFFGRSSHQRTVGLAELAQRESAPLMSCASEELPSDEPMWCANPDSPHCIPALPKPARADLSHGPVAVLWAKPAVMQPPLAVILAFPALQPERAPASAAAQRPERPPRCA